jgi:ABC-type uncharacterized transport system permease subunit
MKQKNNQVNPEIVLSLEFHTKLPKEQRKKLINWFKNQNVEFQILIFDEQKNQFFKLKFEGANKNILSLASFLLAIKNFYDKEQLLKSKNKSQSLNELENAGKIERVKIKKEKPKQKLQLLLSMHSVIERLHFDGYSSREIEKIFFTKYKKNISHSYVNFYIKEYVSNKNNSNVH